VALAGPAELPSAADPRLRRWSSCLPAPWCGSPTRRRGAPPQRKTGDRQISSWPGMTGGPRVQQRYAYWNGRALRL